MGLKFLDGAYAHELMAIALEVTGPNSGFPATLGVSLRSQSCGITDLVHYKALNPGIVICLVQYPTKYGDGSPISSAYYHGEITFALWRDETFSDELARIPWREWNYPDLGSMNVLVRIDPCTASYIEYDFETMRKQYAGKPSWDAHPVQDRG